MNLARRVCVLLARALIGIGLVSTLYGAPLPVDKAFSFQARLEGHTVIAEWDIQEGYYLYQKHFNFSVLPPDHFKVGNVVFPSSIKDNAIGEEALYAGHLLIPVPLIESGPVEATSDLTFTAHYQGCAKTGLCYPPVKQTIHFTLPATSSKQQQTWDPRALALLSSHKVFWTLFAFLVVGMGLVFTPCVLPMIPILSSIIVLKSAQTNSKQAFLISLTYVLSLSITFAIAGVIAGIIGFSVQAAFQNPWIVGSLSVIFILLSASMLGLFELKLPKKLHHNWLHFSPNSNGRFLRAILLGAASSLILSPCITPVFAGALLYIGQSGNFLLGGAALSMMGLGMGIPLIVIGTFEGALLPKTGPWTRAVKIIFGLLLLAVALWLLARVVPFKPLENFLFHAESEKKISLFRTLYTLEELKQELSLAKQIKKPVVVALYATWCPSCQTMEKRIFQDLNVQDILKDFVLLRADVTTFNEDSRRLMAYLHTFAPPLLLFYNEYAEELIELRTYGMISRKAFLERIERFNNNSPYSWKEQSRKSSF